MLRSEHYTAALTQCAMALENQEQQRGAEKALSDALENVIEETLGYDIATEVTLGGVRGMSPWGTSTGRIDLVLNEIHGIELKVVQMPRIGKGAMNALYDVGQLSSDYWRLQNAPDLKSGELIVLLMGPLVGAFPKPSQLLREFHNRMYVDFRTSMQHGELWDQSSTVQRARQIDAIYQMGFDQPYSGKMGKKVFSEGGFGLVSIPIGTD